MEDGWGDKYLLSNLKFTIMKIRFQCSPTETKQMNTEQLRKNFLIEGLMQPGTIQLTYSHYDRMIVGGVMPTAACN